MGCKNGGGGGGMSTAGHGTGTDCFLPFPPFHSYAWGRTQLLCPRSVGWRIMAAPVEGNDDDDYEDVMMKLEKDRRRRREKNG